MISAPLVALKGFQNTPVTPVSLADHTNISTPVLFFKENPVQYNLRDILRGTLPLMLVHNKNDNYISH